MLTIIYKYQRFKIILLLYLEDLRTVNCIAYSLNYVHGSKTGEQQKYYVILL